MEIRNFVVSPSAVANSLDQNTASATIYDETSHVIPGVAVTFTVSGSAVFEKNSSSYTTTSDGLGHVSVNFVDTVAETVTITISLVSMPSVHQSLTTEFVSSSGNTDNIFMLTVVDEAKADGEDRNTVVLQTRDGATPVPNESVGLGLSHGALFINNQSTMFITTGDNGSATIPFTSTQATTVRLTAYLANNPAVFDDIEAHFIEVTPEMMLNLEVISNNAEPNGQSPNIVQATITNKNTGAPLSGVSVTFSASGTAKFENGEIGITDLNGQVYASLTDTVSESVTVTATAGEASDSVLIQFWEAQVPLSFIRIFNINKSFSKSGPSTAWDGALFYIEASGGTGHYEWTVEEGSDLLSVTDSHSNQATFHFSSFSAAAAERNYVIRLSDGNNSISYSFTIDTYFTEFGNWEFYGYSGKYPSVEQLVRLFNEWGNMHSYDYWLSGGNGGTHYWTNNNHFVNADAVNLTNGNVDRIGYFLTECGYAASNR